MQLLKKAFRMFVKVIVFPFKLAIRLVRSKRIRRGVAYLLPVVRLAGSFVAREGKKRLTGRRV